MEPLIRPELEKKFSIENFYAACGTISEEEEDSGFRIEDEDSRAEELARERNQRYMEICTAFFSYLQREDSFEIKKFIRSLSMDELMRWNRENALPNTLMTIYQKKVIDVEALHKEGNLLAKEPLGEFDLLWVLGNLPRNYLDMKKILFFTSDRKCEFTVEDGDVSMTIEMTNFTVEVER
jgi:hypothetical protein